ncbi:enoyl-CoA hydratase/isomerase family protein [Seohaeicola zhoushanensis]|uniref:Enoyl-CoA hydratase n=1 Tax=Seohaeicola zhoushanensis TaxID=1569283 RepID=A0A8J3MAS2_9RHOB|nr:enoyl-CoA hydratase/isomerase family protein [Seohaeicola zhoushanensis]GHF72044.1 enoyl-CoA hydratase [Seohaeicola zhoushanensis]
MTDDSSITLTKTLPIATIILSRPDTLNALSFSLLMELDAAIDAVAADPQVRVLVIKGQGRAFCAGANLKDVLASVEAQRRGPDFLNLVTRVFGKLRALPKPVLGGINGIAVAGGLELAMCCDMLIAAEDAVIGDAHSNFGLLPGAGGAAVLPARIGLQNAKYMLFTGDSLPAAHWLRMGLLQEVVPDDDLDARLEALALHIASKSPRALAEMKAIANATQGDLPEVLLQREIEALRVHLVSEDAQEGLRAFAEKRRPVFTGK